MQISKVLFDLLRALNDSVISLDSEMNITQANSSETNLFDRAYPSEAIGKNIYEFAPQAAEKIFNEEILEAITKNEITSIEWQGVSDADLWRTTIFPATDGLVMISRAVEFR